MGSVTTSNTVTVHDTSDVVLIKLIDYFLSTGQSRSALYHQRYCFFIAIQMLTLRP